LQSFVYPTNTGVMYIRFYDPVANIRRGLSTFLSI
jgi:hypothetical protein